MNKLDQYFMNQPNSPLEIDTSIKLHLQEICDELKIKKVTFSDLLLHLEIYLADKRSEINRNKAYYILLNILEMGDKVILIGEQLENFFQVLLLKMENDVNCIKNILKILDILKKKFYQKEIFTELWLNFLKNGKFNTQDFKREVRGIVFRFLIETIPFYLNKSKGWSI